MLIVCPSCASRYELDAAKLGAAGRKVRCASCQTSGMSIPARRIPEAPSAEETQALLDEELQRASEIDEQITRWPPSMRSGTAGNHRCDAPPPRKGRPRQGAQGRAKPARPSAAYRARVLTLAAWSCSAGWSGSATSRCAARRNWPWGLREARPAHQCPGPEPDAVESGLVEDGQGRFLVVEGDVTNITKRQRRCRRSRSRSRMPPARRSTHGRPSRRGRSWSRPN
jgi:predicted Zn finger-like uncharacterized protein